MHDLDSLPMFPRSLFDPGQTAGIACCHDLGVCRYDTCPLLIEKLTGDLGLREIVDSCTAAAGVGVLEFLVFDLWDGFKKFPWLSSDSLAV